MTGVPPTPPPATPPEGRASGIQGGGVHLLRDLPIAESILWHPSSPNVVQRRPPSGPYPVFFDQKAIAAVHAHYETAGRQGMMGFLVGDLFECPESHTRYVVIDSTIRLNQAVYGDKTLVIVSRLWDRIQEELKKIEGHLIGWYHSHPPSTVELAPGDVETHLQYFKRPWHVALVLGGEHEGPVAGLFRPRPGETAASTSLPFYELIEIDDGVTLDRKQSVLPWINFLTDDPAVRYADASAPPLPVAPPSSSTLEVVRPVIPSPKPAAVPLRDSLAVAGTQARPALSARPQPSVPPPPPAPPSPPPKAAAPATAAPAGPQMKSPPNALSDLPLVAAGGYELGEVHTSDAEPGVMRPKPRESQPVPSPLRRPSIGPPTGSPVGRPTGSPLGRPAVTASRPSASPVGRPAGGAPVRPAVTPRAFAPALAQRRNDGNPGFVAALLLLLIGGGGFAGWWYFLRPQAAAGTPAVAATDSTTHASQPATDNRPPATVVDSPLVVFDRNAESVTAFVQSYNAHLTAGQLECPGLSQSLVSVEDAWTRYNVGKQKTSTLDADHFTRDQRLYAAVDSVERHFDRSGCARP